MSLLIPPVVVYGFSFTVDQHLIHQRSAAPNSVSPRGNLFRLAVVFPAAVCAGAHSQRAIASPHRLVRSRAGCADSRSRRLYRRRHGTLQYLANACHRRGIFLDDSAL